MNIQVQLFAAVRDSAGSDQITVSVSDSAQASDVIHAVANDLPEVADLVKVCRLAVNDTYVSADHPIDPACQCAIIPPVSGG